MVSCNIKKERNQNVNSTSLDSINTRLNYTVPKPDNVESIDFQNILRNADTLITSILGRETSFKLLTDTLKHPNSSDDPDIKDIENYIYNNSYLTIRHFLEVEPPNKHLSLFILEAQFNSNESLDPVLLRLKYLANKDKSVPGLTYSNDYIAIYQKYLLWIHSRCIYSYQNHMRFTRLIQESFNNKVILDSIRCRCGAVKCE